MLVSSMCITPSPTQVPPLTANHPDFTKTIVKLKTAQQGDFAEAIFKLISFSSKAPISSILRCVAKVKFDVARTVLTL